MTKKKIFGWGILIVFLSIAIAHFIYKEIQIRTDSGCTSQLRITFPSNISDEEAEKQLKKANLKRAREKIHCKSLFDCDCY